MDDNSIKDNICRIRKEKGLSQNEMAERLGMERNSYRSIEKGPVKIINPTLFKIAEVFGVPVIQLITGADEAPSADSLLGEKDESPAYGRIKVLEEKADELSRQTARLEGRVSDLEEMNGILKARLKDKEDIIALLKKNPEYFRND